MSSNNLLKVIIVLLGLILLLLIALFIAGALFFNEVQGFELPDFTELSDLVSRGRNVLLVFEDKIKVFNAVYGELDAVNATKLITEALPYWSAYYVNGSDC